METFVTSGISRGRKQHSWKRENTRLGGNSEDNHENLGQGRGKAESMPSEERKTVFNLAGNVLGYAKVSVDFIFFEDYSPLGYTRET